ncbi:MAG: hypothetical protein GY801_04765 [bacterium]|nr:hypothetical protein [bacterium]
MSTEEQSPHPAKQPKQALSLKEHIEANKGAGYGAMTGAVAGAIVSGPFAPIGAAIGGAIGGALGSVYDRKFRKPKDE